MDDMLRVEVRFKNGRLYDAILAADVPVFGGKSEAGISAQQRGRISAFCRVYGIGNLQNVYQLLNLQASPYRQTREGPRLREICQALCNALEKDPAWLFPAELYERTWRPYSRYLSQFDVKEAAALIEHRVLALPAAPDDIEVPDRMQQDELRQDMQAALHTLTPRIRKVIEMRYGLNGQAEATLEEVAAVLGVSKERIRQLESRGMRNLRHPSRTRYLRGHLL